MKEQIYQVGQFLYENWGLIGTLLGLLLGKALPQGGIGKALFPPKV